jgi:hypothetical protein
MDNIQAERPRIVPLKGSIRISVGMLLGAVYPNMNFWQKGLIKMFLTLDRLRRVKLW